MGNTALAGRLRIELSETLQFVQDAPQSEQYFGTAAVIWLALHGPSSQSGNKVPL